MGLLWPHPEASFSTSSNWPRALPWTRDIHWLTLLCAVACVQVGMLPKRRFFLLGHPISQSPSPAMHNAGFAKCQMPHEYVPKYILQTNLHRDILRIRSSLHSAILSRLVMI